MKILKYVFAGLILCVICYVGVSAIFSGLHPQERNLYGLISFIYGVFILALGEYVFSQAFGKDWYRCFDLFDNFRYRKKKK